MVLRVTEVLTQNCLRETIIFSHTREFWDGEDLKTGNSCNSQFKSGGRQFPRLHSAGLWVFPTGQSKMAAETPHDRRHRKFSHFAITIAKSLQSCPTLCDPIDSSPPGFPIPGILQARTLEWVAISFSNAWKWKVKVKLLSHVRPSATPWTAAFQAPPSMGFSRQEYWSGMPLPSPSLILA